MEFVRETRTLEATMGRWIWLFGVGVFLLGFFVGKEVGPASVVFPDPDEARDEAQMERAVERALLEPRAFPRASALIRLFEGLTEENVTGASSAIAARAGLGDPVDLQLFLGAWIVLDPLAAIREVQSWPIRSRREIGLITAVREWAASGRQLEATDYFQTLTDPETREMAAGPLVRGWALSGDVDGALALARRLWESEEQRDVADGFVRGVLHVRGPEGAIAIAREVVTKGGDPSAQGEFEQRLTRVTLNLAGREDPALAAAFYDELTREGSVDWLDGSLARLAGSWRNDDPEATLDWLLDRPDGPERAKALTETVGTWAIRDFDAAWTWFGPRRSRLEGGGALDRSDSALLAGLVRRMSRTQPAEAARWVTRLPPESDRVGMIRRVAFFWSMGDAEAASQWIDGLSLGPAQRESILQAAERGRRSGLAPSRESDSLEEAREPEDVRGEHSADL